MSVDGREVLLDQGGAAPPTDEPPAKPEKKKGGRGASASSAPPKSAPGRSGVGVVTATLIPNDGHITVPMVARETGKQCCLCGSCNVLSLSSICNVELASLF